MQTMNDERPKYELIQELIKSGKIRATHRRVKGVWTPEGWEVLESKSIPGYYFHHHPEHGDWSSVDEAKAISKCNKDGRWKMNCIDEGRHKGKVIGPYSTKCMRILYLKRKENNPDVCCLERMDEFL